jgi:hypothetical protein
MHQIDAGFHVNRAPINEEGQRHNTAALLEKRPG